MMRLEHLVGIGCLLLAMIFLFMSFDLAFYQDKSGSIGPGFFPRLTAGLLVLLSTIYVIQLFKDKAQKQEQKLDKIIIVKQVTLLTLLILCIFLSDIIGMLLSIILFLFIMLVTVLKVNWAKSLGFTILTFAIMYLIFEVLLGISLPKGTF